MAEPKRKPQETKEIGIKRLKESYEQNNRTVCPPDQIRKFERLYEKELLPRVYEK